jgi:tetratricopeptide (TPR) repeat protein
MLALLLSIAPALACQTIGGCEAAVQRAPADPALRRAFGLVLLRAGDTDAALESYRTAIALAPNDARGYEALGGALAQMRDHSGAMPLLERAIALDPEHAEGALRVLQYVQEGLRLHDAALDTARKLAERGDVLAMYDLALALEQREPERALLWLNRAAGAGHVAALERLAALRPSEE